MRHWWKTIWNRRQRSRTGEDNSSRRRRFSRLYLEPLEDRTVLNAYTSLGATNLDSLTGVQQALSTALNNASKVPLLTQDGNGVLGRLEDVQFISSQVVSDVRTALNDANNDTDSKMASALADAFGVSAADVKIDPAADDSKVDIIVHFHRGLAETRLLDNFSLNLGLPGLPVKIETSPTASIDARLSYDYAFEFGFDPARGGLFVDPTSKLSDFAAGLPDQQFVPHADVAPSATFETAATLGLLRGKLTNLQSQGLSANVVGNNIGLTGTPDVSLSGSVDLKLRAEASFDATTNPTTGASFKFPSIGTDLNVNWVLPSGSPNISYSNVSYKLGTFLSDLAGPII